MNVFQIQLPVKGNDGRDNAQAIDGILEHITEIAGGCTAISGIGLWRDDSGKTIQDKILNVTTYCDDEQAATLKNLVWYWCDVLDQDALVWATWATEVQFVTR